jgi:two-component system capsular synthesis sensor histidine kinase RcsC
VTVTLPLLSAGDAVASAAWTLPDPRPAILCHALEYKEWLTNLFDPLVSNVTHLSDIHDPVDPTDFDYVLVTDEFAAYEVLTTWGAPGNVIWLQPDGPLVPVMRGNGGVEVNVYSHSGIKAATQMLRSLPPLLSRGPIEGVRLSPPGRNFGRVTVLIAEDNLLNRGLLCDQLTTLGANVVEATQGDEALLLFQKEHVDIVLTDIDMPVMNGYELLKALRTLSPSIPVYAISASARPEDIAEGRRQGFSDYLSKPVPLAALAAVLDIATSPDQASRDEPAHEIEPPRFPDVPQKYVDAFIQQATTDQNSLATILEARDLERLKKWAHGVSGGLSVLGPSMLLDLSQELRLQMATSEEWNAEIEQLAVILGEELAAVRDAEQSREKG